MARYADSRIGFVDAASAALAERLAVVRVYTLDRRDFTILRPRHAPAFEILPIA
jgi:predicted nucleic acid-binding protein